jgi:O-antigen/teichoic acid export membrane protein
MLFLGAQQACSLVCSLALHAVTGRVLGPEAYGTFWLVNAVLGLVTLVFLTGIPVAVAKFSAEDDAASASIRNRGLALQGVVAVALAALCWRFGGALAAALDHPEIGALLRPAALTLPFTGLAMVYVHHWNGVQAFRRQAAALASSSVAKVAAIALLLWLGFGIEGALQGLVVASAAFLAAAAWLGRSVAGNTGFATARLARLALVLSTTSVFTAIWAQMDLLMLEVLGDAPGDIGFYTAASMLASAPAAFVYPLLMALLPAFSRASLAAAVSPELARTLGKAMLYSFVALCPCVVGAFLLAPELLSLFFGGEFAGAARSVGPIAASMLFFTLFEIVDTCMRASGRAGWSLRATALLVALHFALNCILIPRFQLLGAVVSVLAVCLLGCVAACAAAVWSFGVRLPWSRGVWALLWACTVFAPYCFWRPGSAVLALAGAAPCLAAYAVLLVLSRVIDPEDLERFRSRLPAPARARA